MKVIHIVGQLIDSSESILIVKKRKGGKILITDGSCYSGLMLIVLVMTAFVLLLCVNTVYAAEMKGKVVRVLDGDTIEVKALPQHLPVDETPLRIRLMNIDAPETKQPFGRWSTEQLKSLIAGQVVTVTYKQTDRYGRILGSVFTANGTEVSHFMVQSGAAWVYDYYNADQALPALQLVAIEHKRGLWADNQPVPPWVWRHKQN